MDQIVSHCCSPFLCSTYSIPVERVLFEERKYSAEARFTQPQPHPNQHAKVHRKERMAEERVVQPQIGSHCSAEIASQQDCAQSGALWDEKSCRAENEDCPERRRQFRRPARARERLNYLRRSHKFAN